MCKWLSGLVFSDTDVIVVRSFNSSHSAGRKRTQTLFERVGPGVSGVPGVDLHLSRGEWIYEGTAVMGSRCCGIPTRKWGS